MRLQSKVLLAAALMLALAASPGLGQSGNGQGGNGQGGGYGAPGPIAGAGLGYLVLAGGYYLYRRWREQNTKE